MIINRRSSVKERSKMGVRTLILLLTCCGSTLVSCLYEECSTEQDCSLIKNAHCSNMTQICECNNDCFWLNGECVKEYGAQCNGECGGTFVCSRNTCRCPENTHLARNKLSCNENTRELGGTCTLNENCNIENSECTNEKCRCKEFYFERNNQCVPGVGAECSRTACQAENSVCGSTCHCVCLPRFLYSSTERCVPVRSFGDPCEEDEQCSCLIDKNCKLDQTYKDIVCADKQCRCQAGFHYAFRRAACVRTSGLGEQCDVDENCEKTLFSACYKGNCVCKKNYFASEGKCKQGVGSFCLSTSKCSAVEHAKCVKNKCTCAERFVEQSTELCVPVRFFGEECVSMEQCTVFTVNATCEANTDGARVCRCVAGQHHHANGCFNTRKLDEHCDSSSECFVTSRHDSVVCLENKCVCVPGSVKLNETYCDGAGSIGASAFLVLLMVLFKVAV